MFPLLGSSQPGHINLVHVYRNTAGNTVNLKVSISGSAWPQGLEVTDELEYDGTNIIWRSDIDGLTGFSELQRNTQIAISGTVLDFGEHRFMIGLPMTNTGSGFKVFGDDVLVKTVVGP